MDFKKVLRAFLANVLKMPDGDIDAILEASDANEDTTLATLLQKDKDRVANLLKPKSGQTFQDGYKKAKAEVLTALETEIKEKYGIEDDAANPLTGLELIGKVIETEGAAAGKDAKVDENTIKKHPVYLKLEKDSKKALTDLEKAHTQKVADIENGYKKAEVLGSVNGKALEILNSLNPVLSDNAKIAENQRKMFLNLFTGLEYEKQDDGSFIILKDGKRLEDGHGNAVDFETFVKDNAPDYFEFKQNNGGGNAGGGKNGKDDDGKGAKKYPAGVTKPKTFDELAAIMNDSKIKTEDKTIVMETWETENPNA